MESPQGHPRGWADIPLKGLGHLKAPQKDIFKCLWCTQGATETVSHCTLITQMASASSHIISPFPDYNVSIRSLTTFGFDIGSVSSGLVITTFCCINNF